MMEARVTSSWTYVGITAALLALLGITVGLAYVDLGPFNVAVALLIACVKALLVLVFFMHILRGSTSVRVVAGLGLFMLGIIFVLVLSDYTGRNRFGARWLPSQGSEVPLGAEPPSQPLPEQTAPPVFTSEPEPKRQ